MDVHKVPLLTGILGGGPHCNLLDIFPGLTGGNHAGNSIRMDLDNSPRAAGRGQYLDHPTGGGHAHGCGGFIVVLAQMGQELTAFAVNGALWRDLRLCGG